MVGFLDERSNVFEDFFALVFEDDRCAECFERKISKLQGKSRSTVIVATDDDLNPHKMKYEKLTRRAWWLFKDVEWGNIIPVSRIVSIQSATWRENRYHLEGLIMIEFTRRVFAGGCQRQVDFH